MNIDMEMVIRIILTLLTVSFGGLSAYFSQNEKLRNKAVKYIAEAEELYKGTTKSGGMKFEWVVDTLYNLVPMPLRILVTKPLIGIIVQSTFDSIEKYAKMQLDKAVDKILEQEETTEQ